MSGRIASPSLIACSILLCAMVGCTGAEREGGLDKPGYETHVVDGRLWIFEAGSDAAREFAEQGEPAKFNTYPNEGPHRMTIRTPEKRIAIEYLAAKPGFHVAYVPGSVNALWVFAEGSEELMEFQASGEPAKHVTFPSRGPMDITVRSDSKETVVEWLAATPGYHTEVVTGSVQALWVLKEGSEAHADFLATGEPAKHSTFIMEGPLDVTVRSSDQMTAMQWAAHAPGYDVRIVEELNRPVVWVFESGSEAAAAFTTSGGPAKHTTRINDAGAPFDLTIKAVDNQTIDAYLHTLSLP